MFTRIVQQVNGLLTALSTRLSTLLKERLLPNVNKLLASITHTFQSAVSLWFRLVQTTLNIKALVVNRITQARSTNQEPISAKQIATQLGLQPRTIVPPTSQPVVTAQSRKRGRPVGSTKSAQSHSKGNKTVQTRTVPQSIQAGTKLDGLVKQHLQHANKASKKGK